MTRQSPSTSLPVALGLVALMALVALAVGASRTREAVERQFQEQQLVLARLVAHQVGEVLQTAQDAVSEAELAALPAGRAPADRWLASQGWVYDIDCVSSIRVFDATEGVLASLGPAVAEHSHPDALLEVCPDCLIDRRELIFRGRPDRAGRRVEVVLSLEQIAQQLFEPVRHGREGYAWMIGPGRIVLVAPERSLIGTRPFEDAVPSALDQMLHQMEIGAEGVTTYPWEGGRRLAAYAPVRLAGLAISVGVSADASEISALVSESMTAQMLAGMILLLASVGAIGVLLGQDRRHWDKEREALATQVALERAAVHSERLAQIGTLTASVAHEIRGPITVLNLAAEELRRAPSVPAELTSYVEEATANLRRLSADLTEFARRDDEASGGVSDPAEAVEVALRIARPRLRSGPRIEIDLDTPLARVPIDRARLSQVMLNLLFNAADAAGRGGQISVRGQREGDEVVLRVEDDGPGVPAELREAIFEAFVTTKPRGQGTGLGLYLCQRMLDRAGGRLLLDPDYTLGAAFEIRLPALTPRRAPGGPPDLAVVG